MPTYRFFSSNLKLYRGAAGLTQAQLGKKLRLTQGAVKNWERENNQPSPDTVYEIADVLGVSVTDLSDLPPRPGDPAFEAQDKSVPGKFGVRPCGVESCLVELYREFRALNDAWPNLTDAQRQAMLTIAKLVAESVPTA